MVCAQMQLTFVMSTLRTHYLQNVDHTVDDAAAQNPHLSRDQITSGISRAYTRDGARELIADQHSRLSASSLCQLSRMMCANHGGTYIDSDGTCNPETRAEFAQMLRDAGIPELDVTYVASHPTNPSGALAASTPVPVSSIAEYERYWYGRTNIDPLSSADCALPCFPGGAIGGHGSVPKPPVDTSSQCWHACVSNQGGSTAGCDLLCSTEPVRPPSVASALLSAEQIPRRGGPFEAPSMALNACVRNCTSTHLPEEQEACRFDCAKLSGVSPDLFTAQGGCLDGCLAGCGVTKTHECVTNCERLCSQSIPDPAFSSQIAPFSTSF